MSKTQIKENKSDNFQTFNISDLGEIYQFGSSEPYSKDKNSRFIIIKNIDKKKLISYTDLSNIKKENDISESQISKYLDSESDISKIDESLEKTNKGTNLKVGDIVVCPNREGFKGEVIEIKKNADGEDKITIIVRGKGTGEIVCEDPIKSI